MSIRRRSLLLSTSAGALLAACGGGKKTTAQLRLLNALRDATALDLLSGDTVVSEAVRNGTVGAYVDLAKDPHLQVRRTGASTGLVATTPTLDKDKDYALIAYGAAGQVRTSLLQENQDKPASGRSRLLVLHLALDAGPLDIYVTAGDSDLSTATPWTTNLTGGGGSGFQMLDSGDYRIRVTGASNKSDLRLDLPSLTLGSEGIATLILTGSRGGALVHALLLPQQGELSARDNTTARVRVMAAPVGAASLGVTLSTTDGTVQALGPTAALPAFGGYVLAPAGARELAVSVDGQVALRQAVTLEAGGDYLALITATPGLLRVVFTEEDNRPSSSTANARVRLLNATAAVDLPLSLSLDYRVVIDGLGAAQASAPVDVAGGLTSNLSVSAGAVSTPVFRQDAVALQPGGVYTVVVTAMAGQMQGSLRRDR